MSPKRETEDRQRFAAICDWITEYLAQKTGVAAAAIAKDEHFQQLGLDSLAATGLLQELGQRLGRSFSPTLVWEYPTPVELARYLADPRSGGPALAAAAPLRQSSADGEPIAVIGMSCRFPQARNPREYWNLLRSGIDAITEVPAERWDIDALYDPDLGARGKMNSRWGGFLAEVDAFDPAFFGISPREAAQIDPQQRLALELAWEALEDAGSPAVSLRGGRCGVFVGVIWHDYADLLLRAGTPVESHTGTGQSLSIVANRISYALGLQGPSMAIDTACSSSLVAIHLACKSLRDGESSIALGGGVNLMLSSHTSEVLSKFGGLSPRGRCRAFDAEADGFVRGEGGGFVVLKTLSRALRDGDRIYCVIRGSAVNNDGASNGLTAPNPAAQRAVLSEACQRAGVLPREVHYVEAHGTGTKLGDPIEAAALGAVLGAERAPEQPLRVGSVKTNIGHLEGAAGIAGLIKTALAITHRQLPPSLHCAQENPLIPFSELRLEVVKSLESWPSERPALAGVSSFGWGGTNCHILLGGLDAAPSELLLLAAADEESLRTAAATCVQAAQDDSRSLAELCAHRSGGGRHRAAMLARSKSELIGNLQRWLDGQPVPSCRSLHARAGQRRVAFVFSPQGGQWRGMATELARLSPSFRRALAACDAAIFRHGGWSVLKELHAPGPLAETTSIIQPSLFAVQVALAMELQTHGIHPDVVVGHSLGEITAAQVSGALSLDDAARVVVHYSRLQAVTAGDGGMALVQLPPDQASALIAHLGDAVCVAGQNGPDTTVLSGRPAALDAIVAQLAERKIFAARIDVNIAAHGPQMDSILDELRAALTDIRPGSGRIPMWSTSTHGFVDGRTLDGAWFAQNLRSPVRFAEAVRALSESGIDAFVEVNPHPILTPSIQQGLNALGRDGLVCGTLLRAEEEQRALLDTIGRLWIHGAGSAPLPACATEASCADAAKRPPELVVLSARSDAALRAQAAGLQAHLRAHPELQLADVAYSLVTARSALDDRLALAASSREGLLAALGQAGQGELPPGAVRGSASAVRDKRAFLFTGQGAQLPGMGRGLYDAWPVFKAAFDRCLRLFERELPHSLREVMWSRPESAEAALLDQTAYTQPALFTLEYSLHELWQSWGVRADLLAGHSIGELAAACVAGVFSLQDAARLCAARGRLMQALPPGGAMASIAAAEETVMLAIAACSDQVAIAAVNGPQQVVISGGQAKVAELVAEFKSRGLRTRLLNVSHAFHSPLMEPMLAQFRQVAESIRYDAPAVPLVSNLTGEVCSEALCTAEYWVRHVRQAVRFADGIRTLGAAGVRTFVELGPRSTLLSLIPACLPDVEVALVPSLRADRDEPDSVLAALGSLWVHGGSVDWRGVFPSAGLRVELPTYAFQRQRYWAESALMRGDPLTEWLYQVDWPERPRTPITPRLSGSGAWLILADRGTTAATLTAALSARGRSVTLLAAETDAATLLARLAGPERWEGVVYLGGLDASSTESAAAAEVGELVHRVVAPVLVLLKGLLETGSAARLWIVTRGGCALDDGPVQGGWQAALWGLGRTAAVEYPAAWGGLVDLDPQGTETDLEPLVTELLSPDAEDQVALRQGRRHAARLTAQRPPEPSRPLPVSPQGCYLVTGGLGAIGLSLAGWLAARGARHLILTSSSGLPERADWRREHPPKVRQRIAAVEALEAQGVHVMTAAADVADAEQMRALLASSTVPLRGVIHAAGVTSDGLLAHQDEVRLRAVLRPKLEGAWVLHQLTRQAPLDFFVLFSSIATTLGMVGNGTYAAANASLEALAALRHGRGLPALSIAWGLWTGGMAERSRPELFRELGTRPMPTERALAALERVLRTGMSHGLVASMDWKKFAATLPPGGRQGRLLQSLFDDATEPALPTMPPASLPAASGPLGAADLPQLVRSSVAQVLGMPGADSVHPGRRFAELGMDSLMAVQLHRRLQRALGVPLSTTLAFDYPTVERLVEHLRADVLQAVEPQAAAAVSSASLEEPIAIVGMACRFPGEANDSEAVWRLLQAGAVVASEVPASRWSAADWYDPAAPFRTSVARGGFLSGVEQFDAGFFQISPLEVLSMDPQQRLLLEVSWEALEQAGQDPVALRQTQTGVFVGAGVNEYAERLRELTDEAAARYAGTGNLPSVLAGRLSYFLGLHGPSLFVDTACSSSLVALHLACQSLRQAECATALVGGVNLLLSPAGFVQMSQLRALSPDGRCKTFSAEADGYGRAEGCAVVVLKPLRAAERDGNPILGLIRGTAINHDGASNGLTAPNGPAQQAVVQAALKNAGVAPAEVDYVECHGTGTQLGDPIEVQALAAVYGSGRPPERPLLLGAVKANLGHLEAAAGLAGLVKAVLALQHEAIPQQPLLGELNPHIPWADLPVRVVREPHPWPRSRRPRRAAVSAFGISGTNAHAVLEEAPRTDPRPGAPDKSAELIVLSAKTEPALTAQAARLHAHLQDSPEQRLADLAFSLASTRSALDYRLAMAATCRAELLAQLAGVVKGPLPATVARGRADSGLVPKVIFVFPGQGSQWLGMGRSLLAEEPVFRAAMTACDAVIRVEAGFSVLAELGAEESVSLLHRVDVVQPVLFALSVALAALWRSWGIEPDIVVGHSLGEVAAAHVAGALSLADAAAVICRRSRLLRQISGRGEMALIELSAAAAAAELSAYADRLSVAVINSARSTVISGEPAALAEVLAKLELRGVFCRRVNVDVASHSPQVEPLLDELRALLSTLRPRERTVRMHSTVTGQELKGPELSAEYWAQNLRQPVRFFEVMQTLLGSGYGLALELSAHPVLLPAVEQLLQTRNQGGSAFASLRRGHGERAALLASLGGLWTSGYPVKWSKLFPAGGRFVPLPTYPWQRQRYWVDSTSVPGATGQRSQTGGNPLLGAMQELSTQPRGHLWETTLDLRQLPWLRDHRVQGAMVFPGAGYLEMALACGRQLFGTEPFAITELSLIEALGMTGDAAVQLQVVTTEEQPGRLRFQLASRESRQGPTSFRVHARGTLKRTPRNDAAPPLDLSALRARLQPAVEAAQSYAAMAAMGLEYGQAFRGIRELWCGDGEALGRVALPASAGAAGRYQFHPALLDSCLQVIVEAFGAAHGNTPWLPVQLGSCQLLASPPSELFCHARLAAQDPASADRRRADLCVTDATGAVIAEIKDLVVQRRASSEPRDEQERWYMAVEWQPSPVPAPSVPAAGRWLLLGDGGLLGRTLREALQADGHAVVQGESLLPNSTALRALMTGSFGDKAPTAVVHLGRVGVEGATDSNIAEKALLQGCDSVLHVVQALVGMWYREAPRLWLFTRGAQAVTEGPVALTQAPLLGLGRTIAVEHPELRCARVDLDPARPDGEAQAVLSELLADDAEEEVALRGSERLVARIVHRLPEAGQTERRERAEGRPFRLELEKPGVLDHLSLRLSERRPPGPGEVEIAIEAAGLNFADVLTALGIRPGSQGRPVMLGGECAGQVVAVGEGVADLRIGQPVLAAAPGSFGTHVTVPAQKVVLRPAHLSAAQAAALPIAYMTAWYGLVHLGRLRAGERVLIHSATGGTGLAAVHIARHLGAEVFATAGTEPKRDWLRTLGVRQVMDSRSLDFTAQVLAATQGEGVDVVLNSLSGPAIEASLMALGQDGRFIELGKTDIYSERSLGLSPFKKSLSYSAVDMAALSEHRPARFGGLLEEVMTLIAAGVLPALPIETVPVSRADEAFRKMAQAQHIGKLVLLLADADGKIRVPVQGKVAIRSDSSYLVTGGLGGLGLKVAEWLGKQGAGHLILMGRAGDVSFEQRMVVSALAARGTRVSIAKGDVANRTQMEQILADINGSGMPLRGIVHAAGSLDDGVIMQQTPLRFRTVMGPKVQGAWHLHELTRKQPLDFFVLYSSAAGLLGSPGQANYAAANTFLDALAHHRRALGLPAMSIDWGAFSEVGLAAAQENRGARLASRGMHSLTPDQGIEALSRLLAGAPVQMGVVPIDIRQWGAANRAAAVSRRLARLQTELRGEPQRKQEAEELLVRLLEADPQARASMLAEIILAQVAHVLRLSESQITRSVPLTALGLDSLMGLELRNRIESVLGIRVPASLLWSHLTVVGVSEYIDREIGKGEPKAPPPSGLNLPVPKRMLTASDPADLAHVVGGVGAARGVGLVRLHTAPAPKLHLICFPPGGGGPELFLRWTTKLPESVSISGLLLPGRGARITETPYVDMKQLLDGICDELVGVLKSDTPVAFFGHSLGSIVAFETAHQLMRRHAGSPLHVFVSACSSPRRGVELEHHLGFGTDNARGTFSSDALSDAELVGILRRAGALGRGAEKLDDEELAAFFVPSLRADLKVLRSYTHEVPRILSIPITAIVGRQDPMLDANRIMDWMKHTSQSFSARIIQGDHGIRYEQLWEIFSAALTPLLRSPAED